ncbi:hypothetical protein ABIB06_001403 [Bradyrhizobium sp. LB8.2]
MSTSVRSCKQAESRSRSSCPRSKAGSAAASAPRPIAGRRRARPGVRKVGAAVLHHDDFAVEDRSRDGKIERGRDRREALGPIQSGPGVDPRPALVQVKLEPIAVVLDFVEPVVAGGRLGSQRGELGGMNPGIADGFEPSTVRARNRVWVRFANYANSQSSGRVRRTTAGSLLDIFRRRPTVRRELEVGQGEIGASP